MFDLAFIAGAVTGVVRERTYQAFNEKMDFPEGLKHVARGLITEPIYAYRGLKKLFNSYETSNKSTGKAKEKVKLVLEPAAASTNRSDFSMPLED